MEQARNVEYIQYSPIPTIRKFHESDATYRAIIGPVGSAKTSGAAMEVGYYIPFHLSDHYKIKKTRGVVVRNTYSELLDTTLKTVKDWFPDGNWQSQRRIFEIRYADGISVEMLFRSCDNPDDVKKFKSLEITWFWVDEAIEVEDRITLMLKNRIGRYPKANQWPVIGKDAEGNPIYDVRRYGIETTNPPDVEHRIYHEYQWISPPPGPVPEGEVLLDHVGFWQPPRENERNLRYHYYDDLINDYRDNPDWIEIYIDGKPGVIVRGKLIYHNFRRQLHVAQQPLIWSGGPLYRGWDNTGNSPGCVVLQVPTANRHQVLAEFHSDKMNIVRFTQYVVSECNRRWPNAHFDDWADPAGANQFSTKEGGWTSNAQLMSEAAGVTAVASEQNLSARINAVDGVLGMIDGLLIDPSCVRLINGFLGGYCYPQVQTTKEFSDKPEKNRFSHVHDALQYALVKLTNSNVGEGRGYTPPRHKNYSPRKVARPR